MSIKSLKSGLYSNSVITGNAVILPGDFESIATTTVGSGGSATITFSSIPATFTHLQIRITYLQSVGSETGRLKINSDTGNNYAIHEIYGNGSSATAGASSSRGDLYATYATVNTASYSGGSIIDILDYANTNKYKTIRSLQGSDANGSGLVLFRSGLWQSTSAITTLTFTTANGVFSQHSSFALYGIRG